MKQIIGTSLFILAAIASLGLSDRAGAADLYVVRDGKGARRSRG